MEERIESMEMEDVTLDYDVEEGTSEEESEGLSTLAKVAIGAGVAAGVVVIKKGYDYVKKQTDPEVKLAKLEEKKLKLQEKLEAKGAKEASEANGDKKGFTTIKKFLKKDFEKTEE